MQDSRQAGRSEGQQLAGPPGQLDDSEHQIKDAAIQAGHVSTRKFGELQVNVYGGTAEERNAVMGADDDVLTRSAQGGEELKALESRKTWFGLGSPKPFDIMIGTNPSGTYI
jgi:hypothetical protein